jgi:hypothetical protein
MKNYRGESTSFLRCVGYFLNLDFYKIALIKSTFNDGVVLI